MCFERVNAHLFHIRVAGLQKIHFAARMGEYSILVLAKRLFPMLYFNLSQRIVISSSKASKIAMTSSFCGSVDMRSEMVLNAEPGPKPLANRGKFKL